MTQLKIEIQDAEVTAAINQTLAALRDPTPAMRAIANILASKTESNFAAQAGPTGQWKKLKDKKRAGGKSADRLFLFRFLKFRLASLSAPEPAGVRPKSTFPSQCRRRRRTRR